MKTINELQNEVIEEFSYFDDWMDKYQLLIDLGNEQEPLAPEYKTEQNLIDGCQSRVWLQADMEDGKVVFQAESDALIVKGIIALLIKVVSGHTPDVNAAISYDTEIEQNALDRRLMNIISQNYMSAYRHHSREKTKEEKLYLRLLLVTDYICGMTDTYAKTLYQELHGIA